MTICIACRAAAPAPSSSYCDACTIINVTAPPSLRVGEGEASIDWAARRARALSWRVQGGRLSETPYPYDHEPCDTDLPSPKARRIGIL